MKIVFLIRSLNYGGVERQLIYLAEGLQERGNSVVVTVFYSNGPLEEDLRQAGIRVHSLNKRGRWDVLGLFRRLGKFLNDENPDILYGTLGIPNILAIFFKPFYPSLRIVWGVRASNMDLLCYDRLVRLAYWLECRLSRLSDLIIANSHAGFDYAVRNGFPPSKMLVIPNGIDTMRFKFDPSLGKQVRDKWGVDNHEVLFGLIGRFDPMKDHPTFLQAAMLLIQRWSHVRFVCVGDGSGQYKENLIQLADELRLRSHVIWAGAQQDMPAVYNAIDIACSTSSFGEGFPNVIGEAMACGVPCVVTDVGDSKRIVADTGLVVSSKNPEALCAAWGTMLRIGTHGRRQLGMMARERIINNYSLGELVTQTGAALETIVKGG